MSMLTLFEYRTFYPKTKIAYKEYIEFPCSLSMFEEIHSNTTFIINVHKWPNFSDFMHVVFNHNYISCKTLTRTYVIPLK